MKERKTEMLRKQFNETIGQWIGVDADDNEQYRYQHQQPIYTPVENIYYLDHISAGRGYNNE
jgi:hypothetical protein